MNLPVNRIYEAEIRIQVIKLYLFNKSRCRVLGLNMESGQLNILFGPYTKEISLGSMISIIKYSYIYEDRIILYESFRIIK